MPSTSRPISCDAISLTYNWNRQQKNVKRQKLKLWCLHIRLVIFELVFSVKYTLATRFARLKSNRNTRYRFNVKKFF